MTLQVLRELPETLHTYHPTNDGRRGLHAFTTSSPDEALALANAGAMRKALDALLSWQDIIAEAVAATNGEGQVTRQIRDELAHAADLVSRAGRAGQ